MTWWPFSRSLNTQVEEVTMRLEHMDVRQQRQRDEVESVKERLRLLEIQAEVIARQHIEPN